MKKIKLIYMTLFCLSIFSLPVFGQKIKVRGKVTDTRGETLPGVSVLIKGSIYGCATDIDGKYVISADPGDTLRFSQIGMKDKYVAVYGRSLIDIVMEPDHEMIDETVVVGYGVQKKATVTGAVSIVKGDDIKNAGGLNVTNDFAGRIPGLIALNRSGEPGSDFSSILIRGKGTLNDNSPLVVVDGIAVSSSIVERMNPSDIQSVSVLKDASAAIYGARAGNGVILITTKTGIREKPTVEYRGTYTLSQNTVTPNLLDAYDWMTYEDEIYKGEGQTPIYENIKEGYKDGTINSKKYGDTDWMKVIFRKFAPETRHTISLRGGSKDISYYISGDMTYQEPGYRNTVYSFKTHQFRANVNARINENLEVGFNLSELFERRNESPISSGSLFWEAFMAYPYLYDYYPNGLPGPGISWGNNLAILSSGKEVGYDKINDTFMNNKYYFKYRMDYITKGLSLYGYAAYIEHHRNEKEFQDVWDTYTYDEISDSYVKQTTNASGNTIQLSQNNDRSLESTYHIRIDYKRSFGNHNLNMFAAYEQMAYKGENFSAWRGYYLSNKIDYLNAGADKEKTNGGYGYLDGRRNVFGRINYDYANKYMVEFTMRYDGSINFAKEQRWGTFPGISAGWMISREPFMSSFDFIDKLKLRASWGKLGNDSVNQFQYLSTYSLGDGAILGESPELNKGFSVGRIGNPDITWEKVDSKNIAVDGTFWKGKLDFTAEYFFQKRSDILTPKQASVPSYTGLSLPDQNIGKVNNYGVELSASHFNYYGDWKYNIGVNFTFTKNKIVYFDEAANTPSWQKRTGYPIDSWLMYKTDGIYQTQEEIDNSPHFAGAQPGDIKYVDVDRDGSITSNDEIRDHISNIPQIVYGISMGASWRDLSISVLWSGQARAKQMIIPIGYNTYRKFFDGRWLSSEETPDARYPRAFNKDDSMNIRSSDFWLYDASFIRLKNLELSYNLPLNWMHKANIKNCKLFLIGNNLFTIDKIHFQDPESNEKNAGMYYPQQRTYTFGIDIMF